MVKRSWFPLENEFIVFDLDGTLVDSLDFHAKIFQEVLKKHGFKVKLSDIKALIGLTGVEIVKRLTGLKESEAKKIYEEKIKLTIERANEVRVFPGVRILLEKLKKAGFKLGIATSASRKTAEAILKAKGLLSLFDKIVGAEDVEEPKPSRKVLEKFGKVRVFVGDSEIDKKTAENYGCAFYDAKLGLLNLLTKLGIKV